MATGGSDQRVHMGLRRCIYGVLAAICILQTSLLVTFTLLHVRKQFELQDHLYLLNQRTSRMLVSCGQPRQDPGPGNDMVAPLERRLRQVTGSLTIAQFIAEQEAILERHCTNESRLCTTGLKGDPGLNGAEGPHGQKGTPGDVGAQGIAGPPGATGVQGLRGEDGPAGAQGETGSTGPPGLKGEVGSHGVKGDPGLAGAQGQAGIKGLPGAKGDVGLPGLIGGHGTAGSQGTKGEPGAQGPLGLAGPQGAKGEHGDQPTRSCPCFSRPTAQSVTTYDRQALVGSEVTLSCPVTGSPSPTIEWSRKNGGLPVDAVRVGSQLIISSMSLADVGEYTCTATNLLGKTEVKFNVTLFDGPTTLFQAPKKAASWNSEPAILCEGRSFFEKPPRTFSCNSEAAEADLARSCDPAGSFVDLNCNMENGLCVWSQSPTDQMNWTVNSGGTDTPLTGPRADHTLQTPAGKYVYLETDQGQRGYSAELTSPVLSAASSMCLHFWYNMYGAGTGTLSLLTRDTSGDETLLWTKSGNQGLGWMEASATVLSPLQVQVIIRATRGASNTGDIGIDDITATPGVCIQSANSLSCDFQSNFCAWIVESPQWIWTQHQGPSGKNGTGPTADHNGDATKYYAYLNGAGAASAGDRASLTSPFIQPLKEVCLDFYYHLYGSGEGSLSLRVKYRDGKDVLHWQRTGNLGQAWQHEQITIPATPSAYSLTWEATRGTTESSDIALDDLTVSDGACSVKASLGAFGCDFEMATLCSWSQGSGDDLDWDLQVANAGVLVNGPSADHTLMTGQGHYITMAHHTEPNKKATLMSQHLNTGVAYCLQLWYMIPTASSGKLVIYKEAFGQLTTLSTVTGAHPQWTHLSVNVPNQLSVFSIDISGFTGSASVPPLSVDDVSLMPGTCPK